jgi:hypothetical protein
MNPLRVDADERLARPVRGHARPRIPYQKWLNTFPRASGCLRLPFPIFLNLFAFLREIRGQKFGSGFKFSLQAVAYMYRYSLQQSFFKWKFFLSGTAEWQAILTRSRSRPGTGV